MPEYPGMSWPLPIAGTPGRDDAPVSQDALRRLREQRAATAQGIAEYLYRMVMSGQVRDPAVVAACHPLYEVEQQILRMEAALGTSGSGAPSVVGNRGEGVLPTPPGQYSVWQSEPTGGSVSPGRSASASSDSQPTQSARGTHVADRVCSHCRMPLKATDRACPVCGRDTADAVSLASVSATAKAVASPSHCHRCSTMLRPQDRVCPVCGSAQTAP